MNRFRLLAVPATLVALVLAVSVASAQRPLPRGWWSEEQSAPILAKTATIKLAPDLSRLSPAELEAVQALLEAGKVIQHMHEDEVHRGSAKARRELTNVARRDESPQTVQLLNLFRLFRGPIATTLDNQRQPFLAVEPAPPGKNFYPWDATRDEIEAELAAHPERRRELLAPRTVVRRGVPAALRADLAALGKHPVIDALHPGLRDSLRARSRRAAGGFYAVPYSVAHADSMMKVYRLIHRAAGHVDASDPAFARYLRLRARDLLSDDYEAGDAAWVTSRFGNLNAQIGAYESYDDELYGVKTSHGMSVLLADSARTADLRQAIRGLQAIEDALPYAPHKKVLEDIPIGVYDVIADFGESRGTNTASILPNETDHVRRYGRIILMRRNILAHPEIVESNRRTFEAAVAREQRDDFDPEGSFYRTLWHEIGHYLGPDRTKDGRDLDEALAEESATYEEMKADLVSMFAVRELRRRGYYTEARARGVYASSVTRVLLKTKPRPDQVYGTMQLMQLNWYLDKGAYVWNAEDRRLSVRYDKMHAAVASLLEKVLAIQAAGDRAAADAFIAEWTTWDERHDALAAAIRAAEKSRFRLVRYGALGE